MPIVTETPTKSVPNANVVDFVCEWHKVLTIREEKWQCETSHLSIAF